MASPIAASHAERFSRPIKLDSSCMTLTRSSRLIFSGTTPPLFSTMTHSHTLSVCAESDS